MKARDVARKVLARVDEGAYATLALAGELSRAKLSDQDRALVTELVYGVLKQRLRLDHSLGALAPRGLAKLDARVLDALRVGAYQILFLRVPAHAAVDDAVEAIKRARSAKLAGFGNALLRRLAREGEAPPPKDPIEALSVGESAPRWLVDEALHHFAAPEAQQFLSSLNQPAPIWIRVNRLRATRDQLAARLAEERPQAKIQPHDAVEEALRVTNAGDLTTTAAFGEGLFTVQDLAAQRIARLLAPQAAEFVLDACAGVGGKTSHLIELSNDRAAVDAADLSARKLELCADQVHRLGLTGLLTITADLRDPDAPLRRQYDRILLDAPCSGLGVLRRHPEAKWRDPPDRRALAKLQREILEALLPRLKPGGILVYSVCTFAREEGVWQIAALLRAHPELRVAESFTTWPHRDDADAFYAQKLIKSEDR